MLIKKASDVAPGDIMLITNNQGMSVVSGQEVMSISRKGSRGEVMDFEFKDGGSCVAHKDELLAVGKVV